MRRALTLLLLLVTSSAAQANTFRVRNTNDDGRGSLRWAIGRANRHAGADKILFAPTLAGKTIHPLSELAPLKDDRTTINGDINGDGAPDIGIVAPKGSTIQGCLLVAGDHCRIIGLMIGNFRHGPAIEVRQATDCRIRACHLGVSMAGTYEVLNAQNVLLTEAHGNRIGGTSWAARNVIAGGRPVAAVKLVESNDNTIVGNFFGITRDGSAILRPGPSLANDRYGVELYYSHRNTIGGTETGQTNVFAGLRSGVTLADGSEGNTVLGNWFGLAANGRSLLELDRGVGIIDASNNLVGGTVRAARNVFAGDCNPGVQISDGSWHRRALTEDNRVQGNYFGLNQAGSSQRRLPVGVHVASPWGDRPPGRQFIGGNSPDAGNWFCPYDPGGTTYGVHFEGGGAGSVVRNNVFGVYPTKFPTDDPHDMTVAVRIEDVGVTVRDNSIWRARWAVEAIGSEETRARVWGNLFRSCTSGVAFEVLARGTLGNLGNSNKRDDGGNRFVNIDEYFIAIGNHFDLVAEGNDFGTTSAAAIDAKILDALDFFALGRVDYDPLKGGVSPTGDAAATVFVSGAAALPTRQGAEIAFALAAPASVQITVRNLAGRVVAVVCRDRACEMGRNSVVWNGLSTEGLALPAGRYLVEIVASGKGGGRATALAPMQWGR